MEKGHTIKVLDHGYVRLIDYMGSDESFVEAARMSTGKGFLGWYWEEDTYNDSVCTDCRTQHIADTLPVSETTGEVVCTSCWGAHIVLISTLAKEFPGPAMPKDLVTPKLAGKKGQPRDLALLTTLYANKHMTPFEMGDAVIEVMAPIVVIREWFRHRTASYNEFSGRYSIMPNLHYVPERWRIQKQSLANKQGSAEALPEDQSEEIIHSLIDDQDAIYLHYEKYLKMGVAKEVARLNTPVSRYSKFRAKSNIRNWLSFLLLRMDAAAQYEIRVYANAVAEIIKALYPKTYTLFEEYDLFGARLSRKEVEGIRKILKDADLFKVAFDHDLNIKEATAMFKKLGLNIEKK